MQSHPLEARVTLHSLLVAAVVWPLLWLALIAAQGVAVWIVGGSWIGFAAPAGAQPWAIVNQPNVAFAASRAALFSYWLAPTILSLLIAVLAPPFVPVPGGWRGELGVFHVAFAAAFLGLGWAPGMGLVDGPAAGLERFWSVPPLAFVGATALAGAAAVVLAVVRLTGHLWLIPGGPTRLRRLGTVALHCLPPATGWLILALAQGWTVPIQSLLGAAMVLVGAAGAAVWFTPHAPLRPAEPPGVASAIALSLAAIVIVGGAWWVGRPHEGRLLAPTWGTPGITNNLRPTMRPLRLTPLPARPTRPAQ